MTVLQPFDIVDDRGDPGLDAVVIAILGAGQHGEQAQKQDLIERVGHLAGLAWIRQVIEMTKKNNRLVECLTLR